MIIDIAIHPRDLNLLFVAYEGRWLWIFLIRSTLRKGIAGGVVVADLVRTRDSRRDKVNSYAV